MTFKKQFPGLHTEYTGFDMECKNGKQILMKTYSENEIIKHCLDKQKVHEAIQNSWIKHPATESHKGHNGALLELKKELGL